MTAGMPVAAFDGEEVKTHRTRLRPLGPDAMADRLLGILR